MHRTIVDRLDKDYESLNPQQRAELELFRLRKRTKTREQLRDEAEEVLLWLLKQEGHTNVVANFRQLSKSF